MTTRPIDSYGVDLEQMLNELLSQYQRAVHQSDEYAQSTKLPMKSHAATFVRWCATGELSSGRAGRRGNS